MEQPFLSLPRNSLRPACHSSRPCTASRIKFSQAAIWLSALSILPSIPSVEFTTSTRILRLVVPKHVQTGKSIPSTSPSIVIYSGSTRFQQNLSFCQDLNQPHPRQSSSLLYTENALNACARTMPYANWSPIDWIPSHSLGITSSLHDHQSSDSDILGRQTTPSTTLPCQKGVSLPPPACFVLGLAVPLEKTRFL